MASKRNTKVTEQEQQQQQPAPSASEAVAAATAEAAAAFSALETVERDAAAQLLAAYRAAGNSVITLAAAKAAAAGEAAPQRTWSAIRTALDPRARLGQLTVAGRSEATVQRAVKIALWATDDVVASREALRLKVTERAAAKAAAAKADGADADTKAAAKLARDIAADSAYQPGIAGLVKFAEASHDGRVNAETGSIRPKGNRRSSDAVDERSTVVESAAEAAAEVTGDDAEAAEVAREQVIVPGITVGMLMDLTPDQCRTLAAAATKLAKVARPKAAAKPVPPVLETTAAQQLASVTPLPAAPSLSDSEQRIIAAVMAAMRANAG
jgi:hypothetical protein